MATNQTEWARTALRLPKDLHQQVHEAAEIDARSFNGQIVFMLSEGLRLRASRPSAEWVTETQRNRERVDELAKEATLKQWGGRK